MSLIVEVKQGKLQGKENTSALNGQKYYSFLGIPYAKPPVGDLRFKAPEPHGKWDGVYNATHEGSPCIQKEHLPTQGLLRSEDSISINVHAVLTPEHNGKLDGINNLSHEKNPRIRENHFPIQGFIGSEDCLFINVHTPQVPADIKVPKAVLVFIHGGGFFTGSGSKKMYSPDFLITQDIIIVTFNYRLHIFGYLNLGIPDCPGNAGLKDQSLALKWVKENIAKFGGDPANITIFGRSAGASSAHFQIISPLSRGLFNKAILQSGSALVPWAMTFNPKEMAEEVSKRLGFQGGSAQQVLDFLKKQSSYDLTEVVMDMTEELKKRYPGRCTSIPFLPSVEIIKDGAFLPELPQKLLESTPPLPIIYGINNKEGILLFLALTDDIITRIKKDFNLVLKNNFEIDPVLLPTLGAKVKQYYFGDKEIELETAESLVDLYTDIYFYQMYEAIDFVTKTQTPAYVYQFCYDGRFNILKKIAMRDLKIDIKGASHGDDHGYLFHPKMIPTAPPIEGDDLAVINNMITLWGNFAKTGVPTEKPIWTPSTSSQPCYLQIDPTLTLIDGKVFGKRLQFLKDLLGPVAKPYDIF